MGQAILRASMLALVLVAGSAGAQSYPSKPIRLVVPYPPGGADVFARAVLPQATEMLGQPIIVDNRPGANGFVGSSFVAKSQPDGYTLLFTTAGSHVSGPLLNPNVPYDPVKDFSPVINLLEPLQLLTVSAALPVSSVAQLVEHTKRNPGKLSYASSGAGSVFHLNGEAFKLITGTDLLHVPFKGSAPMATDLLAGRIDVGFPALNNVKQFLNTGKLRVLAVLESKRYPAMPDVSTLAESVPGFVKAATWFAMFGPAELPRPLIERLNGVFQKALDSADARKFLDDNGAIAIGGSPQQLAATLKSDIELTAKLIKAAGIKGE
jgi:tripartite-type tricarboxylate transporter receptor subunit TctC